MIMTTLDTLYLSKCIIFTIMKIMYKIYKERVHFDIIIQDTPFLILSIVLEVRN